MCIINITLGLLLYAQFEDGPSRAALSALLLRYGPSEVAVAKKPHRSTTSAPSLGRSDGNKTKPCLHSPPGCDLSTATAAAIGRNFRPEGRSGGGGGDNTQSGQDTSPVESSNKGLNLTLVPFEGYSTSSASCAGGKQSAARSASTSCAAFAPMSIDGGLSLTATSARAAISLIQSLLCGDVASENTPLQRRMKECTVEHPLLKALQYQLQPSSVSAAALHAIAVALQHLGRCGGEVLETVCQGLEVRALAEVGCDGIATNHAALSGGSKEALCLLIHTASFFAWGAGSVDLCMLISWNCVSAYLSVGFKVARCQALNHGARKLLTLYHNTQSLFTPGLNVPICILCQQTSQQAGVCMYRS